MDEPYFKAINIVMCTIYALSLVPTVIFSWRHGRSGRRFWLNIVLFAISRVLAAGFGLAIPFGHKGPTWSADAFLNLMVDGLSALYFAALELLVSIIQRTPEANRTTSKPVLVVRCLQLLTFVGFILLCVGYGMLDQSDALQPTFRQSSLSIAGSVIFDITHAAIVGLTVWTLATSHNRMDEWAWFMAGILLAMTFLTGRLVYLGCEVMRNATAFNPIYGDRTIFLCLAVLMEVGAVITISVIGFARYEHPEERLQRAGEKSTNGAAYNG